MFRMFHLDAALCEKIFIIIPFTARWLRIAVDTSETKWILLKYAHRHFSPYKGLRAHSQRFSECTVRASAWRPAT